ncbi:MAG: AraC family transcriptional regulator [Lachnospiraceae bacterium]|nr:AraC family transcriptional regulator [Lachnospiraceae bacterium]MDE6999348.1 AraC family transcriptional regulator [Lachnospiraceae bacterium]
MKPNFYEKRTQELLLSGYPVNLATVDCSTPDAPTVYWHWHEEVEFQYIQKGQAYITCDEDNFTVSSGDIVFINQAARHFITPAGADGVIFSCVTVHPSFILGMDQLELESRYINPIIADRSFNYLHVTDSHSLYRQFLAHLQQLIALNESRPIGYELLSKACILQLWHLLYSQLPTGADTSSRLSARTVNQDAQRTKQAMRYIQDHFTEPVTLDDIAGSILVSKSECCRCFKRTTGLSPIEYLMKYRIAEATKFMHRRTHDSISEIAGSVGFNNISYFNKVFKKFMDCTPTQYRQSLRKDITPPFDRN